MTELAGRLIPAVAVNLVLAALAWSTGCSSAPAPQHKSGGGDDFSPMSTCRNCHTRIYDQHSESMHASSYTNPVFQAQYYDLFLARLHEEPDVFKHEPTYLVAQQGPDWVGVLPLFNARHASFLHNEVPGVSVPEKLRDRMVAAGEDGAAEGMKIARELLEELRAVVQGAYLMPPFGRYDLAAEIIESIKA